MNASDLPSTTTGSSSAEARSAANSTADDLLHRLTARLQPEGQTHLLRFWEELTPLERRGLAEQIDALDLPLVNRLYREQLSTVRDPALASQLASSAQTLEDIERAGGADEAAVQDVGRQLWQAGRAGVIIVAGGSGSRLGFSQPKGMYPIGPVSGVSLFQWLIEKIVAASRRYGARIPLYLMTSPVTHDATVAFLDEHRRFGLPREDLRIFEQATLPALDAASGQILLEAKDRLALAADGTGGLLRALLRHGMLDDMRLRGLDHLCYANIDNPLASICDAGFLGRHARADADVTTQVVRKRAPDEPLGTMLRIGERVQMVEYSELPPSLARQTERDGGLRFWNGNIAVHVFRREFLQRAAELSLPFHAASKRVPYIDERGSAVEPESPNAVKLEQFIFDAFPLAERVKVVEVERSSHFAAVKNRSGSPEDSPETVRAQLLALHRRWLAEAGFRPEPDALVEISPLLAQDAAELCQRASEGAVMHPHGYLR